MTLEELGFDPALTEGRAGLHVARVLASHGPVVSVADAEGERAAPVRGVLRHRHEEDPTEPLPVVGDWVVLDGDAAVSEVLARRGVLRRADDDGHVEVLAANIDVALIVTSLNRDFNVRRLERFLSLVGDGDIRAIVLLSKGDLSDDPFNAAARVEREFGAETMVISVRDGWGIDELRRDVLAPRRTAALLGTSGVGKSTLVNALLGEERQETLPVRERDDRGRHATTRRELFALPNGALLIDTPGVRLPRLAGAEGLEDAFEDIDSLAALCRFSDCSHDTEPGCAVREAMESGDLPAERLEAYQRLEREARWAEERQGGPGRRGGRATGRR